MSDEIKDPTIKDWNLVSTNMDDNVLNDVTRDDLIDIIENALQVSKAYKVTEILDTIITHMKGYGTSDPHETKMDQMTETVVDRIYEYWLGQGFNGTPDDLRDHMYAYFTFANRLSTFIAQQPTTITTVKAAWDALKEHNEIINTYDNISTFTISEKEGNWTSGIISGMELQTNHTLKAVETPTIFPNSNGKIRYTWTLTIPKRLGGSLVSINVDATTPYTVQYRIERLTDWEYITDTSTPIEIERFATPTFIKDDGTVGSVNWSDPYTYRYQLATPVENLLTMRKDLVFPHGGTIEDSTFEELLTALQKIENELINIEFVVEFEDPTTVLNDIITTVDASKILTDDPLRTTLFRNIPHKNNWESFFTCGDPLTPAFAWFNHINSSAESTLVDWFGRSEGSFAISVQTNSNFLTPIRSALGYPLTTERDIFTIKGKDDASMTISFRVSGLYPTEDAVDATDIYRLDSVQFRVHATYKENSVDFLTPNLVNANRPLWKLFFRYNLYSANFDMYYQDATGRKHVDEMLIKYLYLDPISWSVPTPAELTNNAFIGLHSLFYYNKRIFDMDFIDSIISTDVREIPYLPPRKVI